MLLYPRILGDYKRIVRGGHSRPPDLTPGDALRRNQIHKIQATRKEVLDRFEAREASEKGVPRADGAYHTDETMATRQSLGKRQVSSCCRYSVILLLLLPILCRGKR